MLTLPCLSVRQPYADLIVHADKWCENRSWRTNYRGPLLIHASGTADRGDLEAFARYPGSRPRSSIVGMATLVDVLSVDVVDQIWAGEDASGVAPDVVEYLRQQSLDSWSAHVHGEFCWILRDRTPFAEPVGGVNGRLNLWPAQIREEQLTSHVDHPLCRHRPPCRLFW